MIYENNDKMYPRVIMRRRFCKRILFVAIVFIISFYVTVMLFGDIRIPRVMSLTNLERCPACYGVSVCPELYSNLISLESDTWMSMFNSKNVYYGYTKSDRKVVLKKLAQDWELKEFDAKLCKTWNLKRNCRPGDLLNITNVDIQVVKLVEYNLSEPEMLVRKGLIMCPYAQSFYDFIQPVVFNTGTTNYKSDMVNYWTILSINPEPLILQVIPKSKGWPVPAYGGVCGRLEVLAYEGEPLSSLMDIKWHTKLKYAKKILDAAMDFTFKHDRYRFYLMDWSLDNLVANEKGEVFFVDLEDVVVLDKHISPGMDLPDWYKRYGRDITGPGFTFSIDDMCKHHLSDHNIWAACYIIAGDETPYLYPIPKIFNASRPHFHRLLQECLNGEDRFVTVSKLLHVINEMLEDEKIISNDSVLR